jgi:hypothetical protein
MDGSMDERALPPPPKSENPIKTPSYMAIKNLFQKVYWRKKGSM